MEGRALQAPLGARPTSKNIQRVYENANESVHQRYIVSVLNYPQNSRERLTRICTVLAGFATLLDNNYCRDQNYGGSGKMLLNN